VTELKNTQSGFFYLLSILCFLKSDAGKGANTVSPLPSQGRGQGEGSNVESQPRLTKPLTSILSPFRRGEADQLGPDNRGRWWWFGLSLLFFVLAILSKPSVVMLPVVLFLCIWWRTGLLRQGYGGQGRIRWRDVLALAPFVLISALASVWTIFEQKFHAGPTCTEWAQTWPDRLIIAGRAIWFYLAKLRSEERRV